MGTGAGMTFGRWSVRGRVGAGGMGVVYEAVDSDGRRAALKVVSPAYAADDTFRARFRREIDVGRRVAGPRTAAVLDADPDGDPPWLASEYVEGPTLDDAVARTGPLNGQVLVAFALATAEALEEIHAAGVIHRDLKPSNVILTAESPRVIDFGIAAAAELTSLTATGAFLGSPGWMSPEQVRGDTVTMASDVFAWGALVAFAGSGRPPFGTGRPEALAYRVVHGAADVEGIQEPLRALVSAALKVDVAERLAVRELISELSDGADVATVIDGWDAVPATVLVPMERSTSEGHFPTSEFERSDIAAPPSDRRRIPRIAWAIVATVVVAGAAGLVALRQPKSENPPNVAARDTTTTTDSESSTPTTATTPSLSQDDATEAWDALHDGSVLQRSDVIDAEDQFFGVTESFGVVEVWDWDGTAWGRTGDRFDSDLGGTAEEIHAPTHDWTGDGIDDVAVQVVGNGPFGLVLTRHLGRWSLAQFHQSYGVDPIVEALVAEGRDLLSYEQDCDPSCADGATYELIWKWDNDTDAFTEGDRRLVIEATPQPPHSAERAASVLSVEVGYEPGNYDCYEIEDDQYADGTYYCDSIADGRSYYVWFDGASYEWQDITFHEGD